MHRKAWLNRNTDSHELKQMPGDSEQRSGACCNPRGHKESDTNGTATTNLLNAWGKTVPDSTELKLL